MDLVVAGQGYVSPPPCASPGRAVAWPTTPWTCTAASSAPPIHCRTAPAPHAGPTRRPHVPALRADPAPPAVGPSARQAAVRVATSAEPVPIDSVPRKDVVRHTD